jgi:hypothetical protein
MRISPQITNISLVYNSVLACSQEMAEDLYLSPVYLDEFGGKIGNYRCSLTMALGCGRRHVINKSIAVCILLRLSLSSSSDTLSMLKSHCTVDITPEEVRKSLKYSLHVNNFQTNVLESKMVILIRRRVQKHLTLMCLENLSQTSRFGILYVFLHVNKFRIGAWLTAWVMILLLHLIQIKLFHWLMIPIRTFKLANFTMSKQYYFKLIKLTRWRKVFTEKQIILQLVKMLPNSYITKIH